MVSTLTYESFGNIVTGREITCLGDIGVVYARNPYGSHNLVIVKEIDGRLTAIRHGNLAAISWVASENCADRKIKRALVRCFEAIGYNPMANKPEPKIKQLVRENHKRYLTKLDEARKRDLASI